VSLGGAGTAYSSGEPDFNSVFSGVRVAQSVVFCVVIFSFCPFYDNVLSVLLWFTASDYPFIILSKLSLTFAVGSLSNSELSPF
jgi:hypothetical protein